MRVSGMKQGRKSRIAGRVVLCLSLAAVVAALAAPAALAEPAVDEYTLTLPQASGDQHLTPGAPGTVPVGPDGVPITSSTGTGGTEATDLDGSESEEGLTKKVGTQAELGAPGEEHITPIALDTTKRGVPVIVADTLTETEGGTPLLLAALALIALGGVFAAFRRRRTTSRASG
jgi:hypothetical protein